MTGQNPTDRGKPGAKIHLLADANGLPLAAAISAANTADIAALEPLVRAIPAIRSRRGPRRARPGKLHADKAYDSAQARRFLADRRITPRIARRAIESNQRLGAHRWTIERTISWLGHYRRLNRRYERTPRAFAAFTAIACTLICYRRLTK